MKNILMAGVGYTGSYIAEKFLSEGFKVYGTTRSEEKAEILRSKKITPVQVDFLNEESLKDLPEVDLAILGPAPDQGDEESYQKTYGQGIQNFLDAIKDKVNFLIYLSSTGVWRDQEGDWFDEETIAQANSPKAKILIKAEEMVLEANIESMVFRLSGIYGPMRNRLKVFESGDWPIAGSDQYMNMIHVEDIAEAVFFLSKNLKAGEVYLGVDEYPLKKSELYDWLCEQRNKMKKDLIETSIIKGKRYKNLKLKSLGFEYLYPSFKEGYLSFEKS